MLQIGGFVLAHGGNKNELDVMVEFSVGEVGTKLSPTPKPKLFKYNGEHTSQFASKFPTLAGSFGLCQ